MQNLFENDKIKIVYDSPGSEPLTQQFIEEYLYSTLHGLKEHFATKVIIAMILRVLMVALSAVVFFFGIFEIYKNNSFSAAIAMLLLATAYSQLTAIDFKQLHNLNDDQRINNIYIPMIKAAWFILLGLSEATYVLDTIIVDNPVDYWICQLFFIAPLPIIAISYAVANYMYDQLDAMFMIQDLYQDVPDIAKTAAAKNPS